MKRAIHPIKADMMRLHRMFPAKFGLTLMLAFGLLFCVFLKNGTTLLAFGNSVFGEDIGFCWNVIDPSAPDESLVRSAFAGKQNDKPGYVVNGHLSSPAVAGRLKRPT